MRRIALALALLFSASAFSADPARDILTRLGLLSYLETDGNSIRHRMVRAYARHVASLLDTVPERDRALVATKLSEVRVLDERRWMDVLSKFHLDGKDLIGFLCTRENPFVERGIVHRRRADAGLVSALFAQVHEDRHVVFFWAGPRRNRVLAFFHPVPIGLRDEYHAFREEAEFETAFSFEEVLDLMLEEYAVPADQRGFLRRALVDVETFDIPDEALPTLRRFMEMSPIVTVLDHYRAKTPSRFALRAVFEPSYLAAQIPDCLARLAFAASVVATGGYLFH